MSDPEVEIINPGTTFATSVSVPDALSVDALVPNPPGPQGPPGPPGGLGPVTSATDFNLCTTNGLYSLQGSATHGPPANSNSTGLGILQVYGVAATDLTQTWFHTPWLSIWTRTRSSGVWNDWVQIVGWAPGSVGLTNGFNDVWHTGTYLLTGTLANGPGVSEVGLLRVEAQVPDFDPASSGGSAIRVSQTWTSVDGNQVWLRTLNASSVWAPWIKIGPVIPKGGNANQALVKNSTTDYDVKWGAPAGGGATGLIVSTILTAPTVVGSPYTVNHNLTTTNVMVQAWDIITGDLIVVRVHVLDANNVQIYFEQNAPNNVNVLVIGTGSMAFVGPFVPTSTPSPTGLSSFVDSSGEVWVAKVGVNGGAWRKARDVLHARMVRTALFNWTTTNAALPYDTTDFDAYGIWSAASSGFVTPIDGVWSVHGKGLAVGTAVNQQASISIFKSGSLTASGTGPVAVAAGLSLNPYVQTTFKVTAGTLLQIAVSATTTLSSTYTDPAQNYGGIDYLGTG